MNTFKEFLLFLKTRKRYWLWPFVFLILLLSVFLVLAQGSVLSTFIYSLF